MKQPWSEVSTIQSYRDAKAIHDIYENVYELCLVSRNEKTIFMIGIINWISSDFTM